MSLILDGTNGLSDVDGSAATPAIRGSDANTGIFFDADIIGFSEGGTECARFNADAQFVAAAGTASLPVITTTGDVNTGIFFPAADTIAFAEGGAEAMRIDSSGNLLVGTTSAYSGSRLSVKTGNNNGTTHAWYANNSSNTLLGYQRDDGLFNTGAATNSPYNFTTATAANLFVDASGTFYRSTSSLKYKTNVQDATHGLFDILKLRSVTYKGKNDGDKVYGGLIAEEVHEAGLTEFVQYANDETPDALNYGNMVSLCIKAIQELKGINDAQAQIITALTARVEALEGAQA
jgi:hypothetical protein